ncbi:GNAT family N-acetyltransferase [Actinoplanes sp. CA-252034]|uniref:GNAT family N-acetyltransferase n=1 Tax=Actinoplanes sp. CA-252034 TaxID=3239906 RepID=UPI003D98E7A4
MDQNTGVRLEDAGAGSGVRFRGDEIVDEHTGAVLGRIGLEHGILTFEVAPEHRGRGVATTAVREFSRAALTRRARLEIRIGWEDTAAQRVALAAGYTREAVRRGHPELLVFSRLADDPEGPTPRLLPDLPGGELTDGVITLRPLGASDADFYTELHNVPDVIATSVPPEPKPAGEIRRRCARAEAHWLAGDRADLVILDTATGARAGEIGLYYQEPPTGQAMIGYSMLPAYRGRGFASRAAQLLALWVFAETGVARLIAGTLPTNAGSQRVLEKAGFSREAYLRSRLPGPNGTRTDDVQFVLLAGDLLAQASGENASHA